MYRTDASGKEVEEYRETVVVRSCEYRVVVSPQFPKNRLAGFCRMVSRTETDLPSTGYVDQMTMELDGARLLVRIHPMPYTGANCFDGSSTAKYRLCTNAAVESLEIKGDKLQSTLSFQRYWITDANTGTMEKTGDLVTRDPITE